MVKYEYVYTNSLVYTGSNYYSMIVLGLSSLWVGIDMLRYTYQYMACLKQSEAIILMIVSMK